LQRFTLDIPPLVAAFGWYRILKAAQPLTPRLTFVFAVVPTVTLAAAAALCLLVLALKWLLLGRARPGQHPLWSCWCSRWDYLYTAWAFFTRGTLVSLEGTLLLNFYLRAMGCGIGQRVILGAGFSQVVDPDMLIVDDDATVNCILQAHTFEDRVLKLDRIHIGPGSTLGDNTVPLYGADIGAGAHVAAHSVVMKDEHLLPGYRYEGAPCGIAIDASLRLHSGYERRVPPDTAN
jgi:non-ribosomal peptide synthetase-like protein